MSNTDTHINDFERQNEKFMAVSLLIEYLQPERNKSIYFGAGVPQELIDEVRHNNPHLLSPWDSEAGKAIHNLALEKDPNKQIQWNQISMLRRRLIYTFAQRSSGNFTIVFPDNNHEPSEGALSTIILQVLQRNNNVTTINNQDKKAVFRSYFERIDSRIEPVRKVLQFRL